MLAARELLTAIAGPFSAALVLGLALVPACRRIAMRTGMVAVPRADRWHRHSVALLGGVAIAITLASSLIGFGAVRPIAVLCGCALLMFLVGLVDDLFRLKPFTKLVVEIAIASIFLFFGYRLNWSSALTLDTMLTLVWVVGMTNAFNLLDNMDGLCAGVALIVCVALLVGLAPAMSNPVAFAEAQYLGILAGALTAFLVFNVNPASIFMGDSGSLMLGLSFAALTLSRSQHTPPIANPLSIVAAPVLVLLIPIFDTTLVTLSRMLAGRAPSAGGRDHSSHRLVAVGLSERAAVGVLWLLAAVGGALGVGVDYFHLSWSLPAVVLFLLAMTIFALYLSRIRIYYDNQAAAIDPDRATPLLVRFMYKRQVGEVLLDVCLVTIAYYTAYRLRFEGPEFELNFPSFYRSLPLVVGVQMLSLFVVGMYRGVWRYFGLTDSVVIAKGVVLGTVAAELVILQLFRFASYSRSAFVIYAVVLGLLLITSRASFRLIGEFLHRNRAAGVRVVVYGAGDAAALVVRELMRPEHADRKILGFIDDDPNKLRMRVHGHPVLGGYDSLVALVESGAVNLVVISSRLIAVDRLRDIEALCTRIGVPLLRLRIGLEPLVGAAPEPRPGEPALESGRAGMARAGRISSR